MGRTDLIPPHIRGDRRADLPHWTWLADRIVPWADRNENIRAIGVIGSTVRADRPGDEWSDMDLVIVMVDPSELLDDMVWLDEIGPWWVSLRHEGPVPGLPVRQAVFEGGVDFDIVPVKPGQLAGGIRQDPEAFATALRGFWVVLDKDGELQGTSVPSPPEQEPDIVSKDGFDWVIEDFLFQAIYTTKHLRRGELWLAKDDVDCYMRGQMLQMIEWHARATGGQAKVTWGGARFMEQWADPAVLQDLAPTFASYDAHGVATALAASLDLFERIATETGDRLGLSYPIDRHAAVTAWVRDTLSEPLRS